MSSECNFLVKYKLTFFSFILFLVFIFAPVYSSFCQVSVNSQTWRVLADQIFHKNELLPVWNLPLENLAIQYAQELADRGELSHRDRQNRNAAQRALAYHLPAGDYGEVLGAGPDLWAIWSAWSKSPSHSKIILDSWKLCGGSCAKYKGGIVAVLLFYR